MTLKHSPQTPLDSPVKPSGNESLRMRNRSSSGESNFPELKMSAIQGPRPTFEKLRGLFRRNTGLDFFLFFRDQQLDQWELNPLGNEAERPRYCRLLHSTSAGSQRCHCSHKEMLRRTVDHRKSHSQKCHAGLTTLHVPVTISGKGVGSLQTVCALSKKSKDRLKRKNTEPSNSIEVPKRELHRAVDELQIVSTQEATGILDWLEFIASYLSDESSPIPLPLSEQADENSAPCGVPSVEEKIRLEIGRAVLLPPWRAQRCSGGSPELIKQVVEFVNQNYHLNLSVQIIAQALGFEPSYFAKEFKKHTNTSLTSHLKQTRLNKAHELLHNPHLSIREIAKRIGFQDASYFTQVFNLSAGMTPTQFREKRLS